MAEASIDLTGCDREPIHIPGSIQPHGALLALRPEDLTVVQASVNAAEYLELADIVPGRSRFGERADDRGLAGDLTGWWAQSEPTLLRQHLVGDRRLNAVAHRGAGLILLEFEPAPVDPDQTLEALYPRLRAFTETLQGYAEIEPLCAAVAANVRALTGFDRALIYRFDEDGGGTVIGEDRNEALPGLLGHRFPGSDIPRQARELYKINRLRIIPDATYTPVPLRAAPDQTEPLDLTHSMLRSVSPVHLEYMRNMGTLASMSVSIIVEGELWGLISCHNAQPRRVPLQLRASCDFLGQVMGLQVGALTRTQEAARRVELKSLQAELLALMAAEETYSDALVKNPGLWRGLASAGGAALLAGDTLLTAGDTPSPAQIRKIVEWLSGEAHSEVYATDSLATEMPGGEALAEKASGLLAITISELRASYILWFRPEVSRTVRWAGDPAKAVDPRDGKIHPRNSFSLWLEQVRGRSEPWLAVEIEAARDLRDAVIRIVLRQAEERAELNEELERSNKELEAFSYSISHDLRAPFRHIAGYAELLQDREASLDDKSLHYLKSIREAAVAAGRLVDDLLTFSQLGRASLGTSRVDMNKLLTEVRRTLEPETNGREIEWRISPLPNTVGDASMLRQVLVNLVGNALKYSRGRNPAVIEISGKAEPEETVYVVRDNGAGFDMTYSNKLFGVFQRLHRAEDFEGTGIGLAIARRIVERHKGRIWAEGEPDRGAAFHFALPNPTN
jgi:light-regulated signal transduction histidine kinase (bacteriophytochrome)